MKKKRKERPLKKEKEEGNIIMNLDEYEKVTINLRELTEQPKFYSAIRDYSISINKLAMGITQVVIILSIVSIIIFLGSIFDRYTSTSILLLKVFGLCIGLWVSSYTIYFISDYKHKKLIQKDCELLDY